MSDCISLIDTLADIKDISNWVQVSQMTNVIHTETVEIKSVAAGYLEIEPFCVVGLDCRIVKALVYHCCETGAIHSFTDIPLPHIFQSGPDTCVALDCWTLNPKRELDAPCYEYPDNPCDRLKALRDCQWEWLKAGKKTSWSFRDSSGSKTFLTEACLKEMIAEADAECQELTGCVNTRCLTYGCDSGYC